LAGLAMLVFAARAVAAPPSLPVPQVPDKAEARYAVPADQPRASGKPLELPPIPPSFNTFDGGWIHIAYPPSTRGRVQSLIREADSIRAELSERFGQHVLSSVHVRVARTPGEMTTLAPEGAPYPKYASGVTYPEIRLVLLTLTPVEANSLSDIDEIFRHELAHVALADAIGEDHRVPWWFNEGLAVHLSGESSLLRLKTLSTATLAGHLMPLDRLDGGFPSDGIAAELAYAESADVVRFLLRHEDRARFPALIGRIRAGQSFAAALHDSYALDLPSLEYEWREEVAKRYSFFPVFFSGSLVWTGVLVLFVLGWRRKRQRSRETLERWAREEAFAELRRARASTPPTPRVHILLPGAQQPEQPEIPVLRPPALPDSDVPKVEHEGQWHTLH
jgi:hypothetical protein